ncbi:MAG: hypothetical protein H6977_21150 [Gammaproteobacteria bacterium]|nr:hypothetical protein [Gammaproteobacteria bacterium]MCP5202512.1 hypothetical protein [Gammaproteobacteria bacterium]
MNACTKSRRFAGARHVALRAALVAQLLPLVAVGTPLSRDPFARPQASLAATAALPAAPSVATAPPWQGRLLMTLRAGARSMVNIDGVSVALGEQYRGFELVAVGERDATFRRGAETIELSLDEPPPLGGGGDYAAAP